MVEGMQLLGSGNILEAVGTVARRLDRALDYTLRLAHELAQAVSSKMEREVGLLDAQKHALERRRVEEQELHKMRLEREKLELELLKERLSAAKAEKEALIERAGTAKEEASYHEAQRRRVEADTATREPEDVVKGRHEMARKRMVLEAARLEQQAQVDARRRKIEDDKLLLEESKVVAQLAQAAAQQKEAEQSWKDGRGHAPVHTHSKGKRLGAPPRGLEKLQAVALRPCFGKEFGVRQQDCQHCESREACLEQVTRPPAQTETEASQPS